MIKLANYWASAGFSKVFDWLGEQDADPALDYLWGIAEVKIIKNIE